MVVLFGSSERVHQLRTIAVSHCEQYALASSSTSSAHPRRDDSPRDLRGSSADRRGGAEPSPADSVLADFPRPPRCVAPPGSAALIDCSQGWEGRVVP